MEAIPSSTKVCVCVCVRYEYDRLNLRQWAGANDKAVPDSPNPAMLAPEAHNSRELVPRDQVTTARCITLEFLKLPCKLSSTRIAVSPPWSAWPPSIRKRHWRIPLRRLPCKPKASRGHKRCRPAVSTDIIPMALRFLARFPYVPG